MADLRMVSLGLCDLRFLGCKGVVWARWLRSVRGMYFGGGGGDLGTPSSLRHRIGRRQRKCLNPMHRTEVSTAWDYSGLGSMRVERFRFRDGECVAGGNCVRIQGIIRKTKGRACEATIGSYWASTPAWPILAGASSNRTGRGFDALRTAACQRLRRWSFRSAC